MNLNININQMKNLLCLVAFLLVGISLKSQCTMVCNNEVFVSLNSDGLAIISPDMIFEGDTTGCNIDFLVTVDGPNGYTDSGPTVTLTCDLIGQLTVILTDLNTGSACWSTLNLQDPGNNCDFGGPAFVATGQCFSSVDLMLDGTELIDGSCLWVLPALTDGAHQVEVVENEVFPLNGVSTLDWVLMYQGLVGNNLTPKEAIASDIDNDGTVSTIDMITHRQVILGIDDGSTYDFVRIYRQNDGFEGFSPFDMDDYTLLDFDSSEFDNMNNILIRMVHAGDLNDSAFGGILSEEETELRSQMDIVYEDQYVNAGDEVEVILSINDVENLQGLTTSFELSNGEWLDYQVDYSDFEFIHNSVDNEFSFAYLNASEHNDFEITLRFLAGQSANISELLSLGSSLSNDLVSNLQEFNINLRAQQVLSNSDVSMDGVLSNGVSSLNFGSQFNGLQKTVQLFDMNGRLILQEQFSGNSFSISKADLSYSGMYLVKWSCEGKQGIEKLIAHN